MVNLNTESGLLTFEEELNNDFKSFHEWVNKLWDKEKTVYLDIDIILIKQNMFIISLNSLLENYFEKIIKYIFNAYLDNNKIYSNHFYLAKDYFIESEKNKIENITKNNHNATYKEGFLVMIKNIFNNNNDFIIIKEKLEDSIKKEMKDNNIDYKDFNETVNRIREQRNSLGHNFDKLFSKNNIDYKDVFYKKIDMLKQSLLIIYSSLENIINKK